MFHDHILRRYGASIRVTVHEPTFATNHDSAGVYNGDMLSHFVEALTSARAQLYPASLPKDVLRVEWKIEDYAADQHASNRGWVSRTFPVRERAFHVPGETSELSSQ